MPRLLRVMLLMRSQLHEAKLTAQFVHLQVVRVFMQLCGHRLLCRDALLECMSVKRHVGNCVTVHGRVPSATPNALSTNALFPSVGLSSEAEVADACANCSNLSRLR